MKKISLVMAMALVTAVSGLTACGSSGKTETQRLRLTAQKQARRLPPKQHRLRWMIRGITALTMFLPQEM